MLDIASLQQFDFFSNFTLYAGKEGTYRTISNVVILDHEGFEDDYSDFNTGDFVITNLLYAKDNPDLILSSFQHLIPIGISALAIKSIYFHDLPDEVVALANQYHIPIFFFDSIYIEDVLLNIMDYIRSSSNYSIIENLVDSLLLKESKDTLIKQLLDYCKKEVYSSVSSMYLSYNRASNEGAILRTFNQILHIKSELTLGDDIICTKYNKGFLFLIFTQTTPKKAADTAAFIQKYFHNLLYTFHLSAHDFTIGYNDSYLPSLKIDIAIQRAIYANQSAKTALKSEEYYSKMYLNNLIFSIQDSPYPKEFLLDLWNKIEGSQTSTSYRLSETLIAYVNSNCHIEATGEALFQHPNTVRYRLQKIKTLLGIEDDFMFQLMAILMVGIR